MNSENFTLSPLGPAKHLSFTWFLTVEAKRWRALLKIYLSGQHNFQ
jgi:hypothetical protein